MKKQIRMITYLPTLHLFFRIPRSDTRIPLAFNDLFHRFRRCGVDVTQEIPECRNRLSAVQLNPFSFAVDMEKVVSAVHIPENNVRQPIAAVLVLFFHMIIKHPVLVHAGINLHIRDNDQCFRHFLRRNIVIPCCFQNVFKCSLQIRIHSPANTLNTLDFLLQRSSLQGNKF